MARSVIPITDLPINAGTIADFTVGATAVDAVNGDVINVDGNTRGLLIHFVSTLAAPAVITIPAPVGDAHALRSPLGDVTLTLDGTVAGTDDEGFVVVESSQLTHPAEGAVAAAAGSIRQIFIDYDAAQTGSVRVYRLPRNV